MHRRPSLRLVSAAVLLGTCVAIAICRVIAPRNIVMVGLATMSPVAIILAGVAALVCLSALVRDRAAWAPWALALSGGFMVLHLVWFAPAVVGGQPPRPPGATPVRVMSINMLGGRADAGQIVEVARRADVDILVALEITDGGLRNLRDADISRLLPYHYGAAAPSPAGTMVFLRERAGPVVQLATSLGGLSLTTAVRGLPVRIVAAHPASPADFARWRSDLHTVAEAAATTSADLVIGDLNATVDTRPLRDLMARGGYRDGAELANIGWEPTFPANGVRRRLGIPIPAILPIDHVLVRADGGADRVRLVGIRGTDHAGVIADVWIPATGRG